MPNVNNLKPIIKVTEKQWKTILGRVLNKQGGIKPEAIEPSVTGFTQQPPVNFGQISGPVQREMIPQMGAAPIDEMMGAAEPMERIMGRLYQSSDAGPIAKDYPWAEARIRALKNPELTPENNPRIPETLRLRTVDASSPYSITNADEYTKGLTYERLKWKPIETKFERTNRAFISEAAKEVGVPIQEEQVADMASVFGELWKKMGSPRGEAKTYWEALRRTSRLKSSVPDAQTYFMRSATHWKERPNEFSRQFPREAKRLGEIWTKYMEGSKK